MSPARVEPVRVVGFAVVLMVVVDLTRALAGGAHAIEAEGPLAPWWEYALVVAGAFYLDHLWRRSR